MMFLLAVCVFKMKFNFYCTLVFVCNKTFVQAKSDLFVLIVQAKSDFSVLIKLFVVPTTWTSDKTVYVF